MSRDDPGRASPLFAPWVGLALTGLGILAFIGVALAATFASPSDAVSDGRSGGVLSRSADGFAGLAQLLRTTGVAVQVSNDANPRIAETGPPGLMILTPAPGTGPAAIGRIRARRAELIVLPKWSVAADPRRRGWVMSRGVLPAPLVATPLRRGALRSVAHHPSRVDAELRGVQFPFAPPASFALGPIDSLQVVTPQSGDVLLADAQGRAVLFVLDHTTYVLTDPDLLDNQGLRTLPRARLALAIVDALSDGGPIVFDETLDGEADAAANRSLLRLALTPPFLGATLCAAAAAALVGWRATARFGAPRPPVRAIALGKTSLVENTAVLIRLARREPAMAPRYAALTRRLLARAIAPGVETTPAALDAWLDRLPGAAPLFSTLVAEADQVRTETDLMASAQRLHRRRTEIALGRR